jgi:hypothetical protein
MSYSEKRVEHLRKATEWAEKVRVDLCDVMREHQGRVHFRPASQGVAMVGLLPERPQRGRSGIRDLKRLAREFDARFRRDCIDIDHGRSTPEKRLQSWLLADAFRNGREMKPLTGGWGDTAEKLLFVTDELLLLDDEGRRNICDLLAFRTTDGETGVPVVIELKTARQMTRLIEQVAGYAALVEEHAEGFERLYSAVLGREVWLTGPPEQWVVWPADTLRPDRRTAEFAGWDIKLIGYEVDGDGYRFVAN